MSGRLTTHVLDIAAGRPAAGVAIALRARRRRRGRGGHRRGRSRAPCSTRSRPACTSCASRSATLRLGRGAAVPRRRAGALRRQRSRRAPPRAAARRAVGVQHLPRELSPWAARGGGRPALPRAGARQRGARAADAAVRLAGDGARERARRRLDGGGRDGGARRRRGEPRRPPAGLRSRSRHAAARLPPRHRPRRGRVRRAARRARRDRRGRAAPGGGRRAAVRRRRAGVLRRGGAALRHRLPREPGGRGDARPGDARRRRRGRRDGARGARGVRGGRGAASRARRAAARLLSSCTSSRGRCWSSATRRSASSSAIAGATRAEVRFTRPCRPRGHGADGRCAATRPARVAELVLAVEAAARAEPGLVATVGRLDGAAGRAERRPRARRPPRSTSATPTTGSGARRSRGSGGRSAAIAAARGVEATWEERLVTPTPWRWTRG